MLIKMKYVIHICMFNSCSILTSMEANEIEKKNYRTTNPMKDHASIWLERDSSSIHQACLKVFSTLVAAPNQSTNCAYNNIRT